MRKLIPSPGRLIVKMRPISKFVESGLVTMAGSKILKPDQSIEYEEMTNNHATVIAVGPPKFSPTGLPNEPWFAPGDDVIISRVGGTKLEFSDDERIVVYWLIPYECVQGVYAPPEPTH